MGSNRPRTENEQPYVSQCSATKISMMVLAVGAFIYDDRMLTVFKIDSYSQKLMKIR